MNTNKIIYVFITFCFFVMVIIGYTIYQVTKPTIKYVDNGSVRTEVYVIDQSKVKKLPYCAMTDGTQTLCWNQAFWDDYQGVSIINLNNHD